MLFPLLFRHNQSSDLSISRSYPTAGFLINKLFIFLERGGFDRPRTPEPPWNSSHDVITKPLYHPTPPGVRGQVEERDLYGAAAGYANHNQALLRNTVSMKRTICILHSSALARSLLVFSDFTKKFPHEQFLFVCSSCSFSKLEDDGTCSKLI